MTLTFSAKTQRTAKTLTLTPIRSARLNPASPSAVRSHSSRPHHPAAAEETHRGDNMKRILFILIAIITLGFSACETKKEKEKLEQQPEQIYANSTDSLNNIILQKENELNDMVLTFNEIQDGFRTINEAQGRVSKESEGNAKDHAEAIKEDMRLIDQTMELNKQLIANLQQQLKESTSTNELLKSTLEQSIATMTAQLEDYKAEIADLRQQLKDKDLTIAQQETTISELKTNVNDLAAENDNRARTINSQDKDLHTAYYVFGTKKELKNERILHDGDVLQQGNFNKDYFTKIDTRVDKVIKLYSKSATLKTSHPAGSYTLEKDIKGQYVLRITNPDTFWSVSKYLVIIVK